MAASRGPTGGHRRDGRHSACEPLAGSAPGLTVVHHRTRALHGQVTTSVEEPTAENPSFTRSERGWLLPALFILLVASALTVAGLLVHGTRVEDGPGTTSTTSSARTCRAWCATRRC